MPLFHNSTFPLRRELEYDLTSATREQIQGRTSLVLVDSSAADMVVHGTIRDFKEAVVSEGRLDEKTESRLRITVALVIEDYQNARRWQETVWVDEPVSLQIGETLDAARKRAVVNLAEKIVNSLDFWR